MKRRNALKMTASVLGTAIVGSEVFFSGCTVTSEPSPLLSDADIELMDEIGETILPDSDRSPGAKAARIGEFMKTIVQDCYNEGETDIFVNGLQEIRTTSKERYAKEFVALDMAQRIELLTEYDLVAKSSAKDEKHFFTMLKQLTIWGYFTSEVGATKALRYNPIPGRYDACVDYEPGDKAWA